MRKVARPDIRPAWTDRHCVTDCANNQVLHYLQRSYFDVIPRTPSHRRRSKVSRADFGKPAVVVPQGAGRPVDAASFRRSSSSTANESQDARAEKCAEPQSMDILSIAEEQAQHDDDQVSGMPRKCSLLKTDSLLKTRTDKAVKSFHDRAQEHSKEESDKQVANSRVSKEIGHSMNQITYGRVQKIAAAADLPEFKEVSHKLKEIADFYTWCLEQFGYLVRVWRTLDKDLSMTLTHSEFCIGLRSLGFKGNSRKLVKIFDQANSGMLYYRFFDPVGALKLASLKSWIIETFTSIPAAFKAIDGDGRGTITMKEFKQAATQHGFCDEDFSSIAILYNMLDKDGDRKITLDELDFLRRWNCPEFLRTEPDYEGAEDLKRKLLEFYGNCIVAWSMALDDKWTMCISWEQFLRKSEKPKSLIKGEKGKLLRIWRALDPNLSGWLSLREFSQKAYDLLTFFKAWCIKSHGSIEKTMHAYDANESGMLSRKEFFRLIVPKLQMPDEDAEMLFVGLDGNHKDTIKASEIEVLDKWDSEGDVKHERLWGVVFNALCPTIDGSDNDAQVSGDTKGENVIGSNITGS